MEVASDPSKSYSTSGSLSVKKMLQLVLRESDLFCLRFSQRIMAESLSMIHSLYSRWVNFLGINRNYGRVMGFLLNQMGYYRGLV